MDGTRINPMRDDVLDLDALRRLSERPQPFTPGAPDFWDDPHISASMLAAHLDPAHDAASRRPAVIDRSVRWLVKALDLRPGDALLDLGCGPGLYCDRFARAGLHVTGMDMSRRSIDHARAHAAAHGLAITYVHGDYLEMEYRDAFDAVVLIYGDLCALAPEPRDRLLRAVHAALSPRGRFVLDVTTPRHHTHLATLNHWEVRDAGFWRPSPHLLLSRGFSYSEQDLYLEQYIVVETNGVVTVYRNWFQDYTRAAITDLLEGHGFHIEDTWGDLTGQPYDDSAEWIGIVARKQ